MNRLKDVDLNTSGEISQGSSSASDATGGGAICGGFEGGVFSLGIVGSRGWDLGISGGFGREGGGGVEAADCEWRSKKCWIPNLDGWEGWFWFDFLEEEEDDHFFLGAMRSGARVSWVFFYPVRFEREIDETICGLFSRPNQGEMRSVWSFIAWEVFLKLQ